MGKWIAIGCGILLVVGIASAGGCALLFMKFVDSLPADAKPETLIPPNQPLISRIEAGIRSAGSLSAAADALRLAITDDRVWYLAVHRRQSETTIEARRSWFWSGSSTAIINGAGAGHLDTKDGRKDIRILQGSAPLSDGTTIRWTCYLDAARALPGLAGSATSAGMGSATGALPAVER